MAIAAVISSATACGEAPLELPPEPVGSKQQPASQWGGERLIPLRIVQMANDCTVNPYTEDPGTQLEQPPNNLAWKDGNNVAHGCGHPGPPSSSWNSCGPCTTPNDGNCGPDTASYAEIRATVDKAN